MEKRKMKIEIKQKELNRALQITSKAITAKTPMEILKGFLLQTENNQLYITGNNLQLGIKVKIDCEIEEPGKTVVEAKLFLEIVRKLSGDIVKLEVKDGIIEIKSGRAKFTIREMSSDDFPTVEELDKGVYQRLNPEILKDMIRKTSFAVSTDISRPLFNGVKIEIRRENLKMFALDGYRIAVKEVEMKADIDDCKINVPTDTINEVMNLSENFEGDVLLGIESRDASFQIGDVLIKTQLIAGEYDDYNSAFPSEFKTTVKLNRKEFLDSLDRAMTVSENRSVKFEINEDGMTVMAKSNILGDLKELLDSKVLGESLIISFNIMYFTDVLKNITNEEITLKFNSSISPCILTCEDEPGYTYLLLPVRM